MDDTEHLHVWLFCLCMHITVLLPKRKQWQPSSLHSFQPNQTQGLCRISTLLGFQQTKGSSSQAQTDGSELGTHWE